LYLTGIYSFSINNNKYLIMHTDAVQGGLGAELPPLSPVCDLL